MDAWQRLGDYGVGREEPIVPSQSVTGKKYLARQLQWRVGSGCQLPELQAKRSCSQSKCNW